MQGKVKEDWMQLCEQVAIEQDTERMIELVRELNRMLDEKEQRLGSNNPKGTLPFSFASQAPQITQLLNDGFIAAFLRRCAIQYVSDLHRLPGAEA